MLSGESYNINAESYGYILLYSTSRKLNDPHTPTICEYQEHKSAKENEPSPISSYFYLDVFALLSIKIKQKNTNMSNDSHEHRWSP